MRGRKRGEERRGEEKRRREEEKRRGEERRGEERRGALKPIKGSAFGQSGVEFVEFTS